MCGCIAPCRISTETPGWPFCGRLRRASEMPGSRRLRAGNSATTGGDGAGRMSRPRAAEIEQPQQNPGIRKRGEESMRQALHRMSGVDLTTVDALGVGTVETVLSEYGPDLSRFPTEKEFVSHVTLAPHRPVSGDRKSVV